MGLDASKPDVPFCGSSWRNLQHDLADGQGGVECKFYFCPRGIGRSADPDGAGEVGAPVVPCPSLGGNFEASLTMAAARSLLVLHAGSEMRHCASVYLHPQSQVSALSLCNAAMTQRPASETLKAPYIRQHPRSSTRAAPEWGTDAA